MMIDVPEYRYLGSYKYPIYHYKMQSFFKSFLILENIQTLILDAGCGSDSGYITKITTNTQGIGLDIDRANIEKAIKISKKLGLNGSSFLVGDIEKMPFRKNIFNLIVCQDVLEHIKGNKNAIREMAFILKRGGKILIGTSNSFNPAMFIDSILPKKITETLVRILGGPLYYERNRRLNPYNLNKIIIKNGLRIKKLLMMGYPPIGKPWTLDSKTAPPKIYYLWIVFNKLTNIGFLKIFKELMIVIAQGV